MSKAQLPLLTSIMMVTQAFLAAPAGIRAKRSIRDRNAVILVGYAAMIAADLTFALVPSVYGMPHHSPALTHDRSKSSECALWLVYVAACALTRQVCQQEVVRVTVGCNLCSCRIIVRGAFVTQHLILSGSDDLEKTTRLQYVVSA